MRTKVIIADDKKTFRDTLKNTLQIAGKCEIIAEAQNGQEYLDLIDKYSPDVTFMDIEMPGMNGITATRKALQKNPELTIIGLSFYNNNGYIEKLLDAGAKGYLLKLSNNLNLFKKILKYPKADYFFSDPIEDFKRAIKGKAQNTGIQSGVKNILIVDDFETNTIVIESALASTGKFKVFTATGTEKALKLAAKTSELDLVVADYNMPDKNGAELIYELKKFPRFKNVPMLILSSDPSNQKRQNAKAAGASGWIKKPFNLEKFLNIVDAVIKK